MTPEQLKASILQRAMEGKLVPQDPTDEPASELLKRIKAEKENLIADGKIKRDKKETELFRGADGKPYEKLADGTIQEVEVPYEIPESWNWVKLRNIGSITSGGTPKSSEPSYYGGNITWITPADMGKQQNNKFFAKSSKKITELGLQKSSAQLISKNSIVYSSRAPIGHINIVTEDYTTNQGCKSITPLLVDLIFLYWLLQFRTKDIILRSSGTTFKEISASGFGDTLLPLPPLAEQKRIVAQIEKALAKVDEYAESYNKLQQLDKEFPDKLKKSILQYAMQGKLVAQSPDDEPVEVLLEKIKAEKQKLYEEGKLKKKDLEELVVTKGDDNSPYGKIPKNWSFLTIKDIFSITTGLSYKKTDLAITKNGVRIIRGGNINPLSFKILDNDYYIDPKFITSETVYLKRNQLLTPVSTSLEHIGKFARIDKDYPNTAAGGFVFQLTPFVSSDVLSKYLLFSLSSPIFYEQLKSITKLSGQALYNIPKTKLNELLVPLAPETEQKRISQRVEQLFEKVNQL
ncbi:TPA: restriction endonuclease subunit S [Streptococcus agalactiae]|uniref:restriction endonuclease subunit S n=3 Tax=Streptococcus agalactiae TaxID=1311 RepID=UPI0002BB05FC|nr:restriction endonuclease subunit S [Streptococcus agalactiae]EPV33577.1 type I restriction endonuclease subunit S [Streptococcus agalactiae GB00887]EPV68448.1 type I restriction endonuclease subunit S [Streptococcus agalactiae GB00933]KAA9034071.1 restriction endonuclease subunit S [Streptococcus agalactiae]KAF0061354.1 restriction endonuclease subunit S [Streptococcus agalactiae]KLJ27171.1 type I restriction modification protein [Streptococcus agalactiae]